MMSKATFDIDLEKLEVTATRVFDAPRERVWRAYSDPKLLPEWWPPKFMKTTVERMEFRVAADGGSSSKTSKATSMGSTVNIVR